MNIDAYISSGIIEQYVMGLCSNEETNELELLRKQHPALDTAVTNFELLFEKQLLQNVTLPSVETDNKISKQLHSLQTPVVSIQKNKSTIWLKGIAAAAVVLLGLSSVYNYTLYSKIKEQQAELSANYSKTKELQAELSAKNNLPSSLPIDDFKVLKNPSITPIAMNGVGYHAICRCTMFWDKNSGKAYIMIHHLVKSGDKKDYQLWAMVDGKPVNVGMVNDEIRDRFIEIPNVPKDATAFSVTLENAGGATTPTIEETYLVGRI